MKATDRESRGTPWDGLTVRINEEREIEHDAQHSARSVAVGIRAREIALEILGRGDKHSFPDPLSFVTGDEFEAEPEVEPDWWMQGGLFHVGTSAEEADVATVITVTGSAGSGKSTLVGDLVRCACDGDKWGGDLFGSTVVMPDGARLTWSNLEMSKSLLRSRFLKPLGIVNKHRYVPMTLTECVPILTNEGRDWWVTALRAMVTHTWVVDSYSILTSVENENDNAQNTRALQRIREVATAAGVRVVVLIDHTGWVATDRMRGASSKKDRIDEMFSYEPADPENLASLRTLKHVKSRWAEPGASALVTFDSATRRHVFTPGNKAEATQLVKEEKEATEAAAKEARHGEARERLVKIVALRAARGEAPVRNTVELRDLLGGQNKAALEIRQELIEDGLLLDKPGCQPDLDNEEMTAAIDRERTGDYVETL